MCNLPLVLGPQSPTIGTTLSRAELLLEQEEKEERRDPTN